MHYLKFYTMGHNQVTLDVQLIVSSVKEFLLHPVYSLYVMWVVCNLFYILSPEFSRMSWVISPATPDVAAVTQFYLHLNYHSLYFAKQIA